MFAEPIAVYIFLALVFLGLGILIGWLLADRTKEITKNRLRTGIAIAIVVVWIMTIIAEIIFPWYTVAMFIHAIMGAVVGYLFSENGLGGMFVKRRK